MKPEVSRDEMIGGRRVVASPAQAPHANRQCALDFILYSHAAHGYIASADLLTRHDRESDFASDGCVYKDGVDPETGSRYLEAIAFEVVSEQNERDVSEKASRMHRRGVRRIFAVFVKEPRRVCEWSPQTESWRLLEPGSLIADPCLVRPLEVRALLDAAAADAAAVEALAAKGNPAIRRREAAAKREGKAEGKVEGKTDAVLKVLAGRGIAVSASQRRTIRHCRDLARLDRWLLRAGRVSSVEELLAE